MRETLLLTTILKSKSHNQKSFVFCAALPDADHQVTEATFQGITQRSLCGCPCLNNPSVIDKLNAGLKKAGIMKELIDCVDETGQKS